MHSHVDFISTLLFFFYKRLEFAGVDVGGIPGRLKTRLETFLSGLSCFIFFSIFVFFPDDFK